MEGTGTAFQAVRRRFESGLPLHFLNCQDVEDFFALFFPQAHVEIDWAHGYTFLDKELQQVVRDAALLQLIGE